MGASLMEWVRRFDNLSLDSADGRTWCSSFGERESAVLVISLPDYDVGEDAG